MTEAVPAAPVEPATPAPVEPAPAPAAPVVPTPVEPKAPAEPAKPAVPLAAAPEEPKAPITPKWPDDWRQQMAGEDKAALDRLARYGSPSDVAKALAEAQKKISEGVKPKAAPADNASDEEKAEWRKANGIPDTVDDFVKAIKLPDKREIGEEDKPVVAAFSERALKKGIAPAVMAEMIDEYYALQEETATQLAEQDAEFKTTSLQALREEWGGDFKANINSMRPYFETVDAKLFDNLMGGRLADGRKIMVSVGTLTAELEEARVKAMAEGKGASAAVSAIMGKAKLHKLLDEEKAPGAGVSVSVVIAGRDASIL